VCQTWVADFAWSGLKFFVRCRSRILRYASGKNSHWLRNFERRGLVCVAVGVRLVVRTWRWFEGWSRGRWGVDEY